MDSRLSSGHQFHSSQDSLAGARSGSTSLMNPSSIKSYSCLSSRRSSRDEAPASSTSSLSVKTAASEPPSMESNMLSMKRSSLSSLSTNRTIGSNANTNSSSRVDSTSSLTSAAKEVDGASESRKPSNERTLKEEKNEPSKNGPKIVSRTNSITSEKSSRPHKSYSTAMEKDTGTTRNEVTSKATTPTSSQISDENKKWSTLEKKWSSSMDKSGNKMAIQSGDTKSKIAQFAMSSDKNNPMDVNRPIERPRDLSFSSAFNGPSGMKMSPGSGTVTPSIKNIKEMAEKWEERSNSVDSNSLITPTNSSTATTPIPALSFSRRSTQDKLLTPMTNTTFTPETASISSKVIAYSLLYKPVIKSFSNIHSR